MKVKRLSEAAVLPQKAHVGDLGYDLFASEEITVWAGQTKLVPTGIAIQFPEGYGALLRDRSSVATKRGLFVVAGVIDNGYIGEIKIALHNSTNGFERISAGEKIAQLILIPTVNFNVEEVDELVSADQRGTGGFGSTGT
jgi:dUTP pyrophosphatase